MQASQNISNLFPNRTLDSKILKSLEKHLKLDKYDGSGDPNKNIEHVTPDSTTTNSKKMTSA